MAAYDAATASHYAAYRPPLHEVILAEALGPARFAHGLDLGCGAGRSSHALLGHCDRVTGVDSSEEMLAGAAPHPDIAYRRGDEHRLPLENGAVDIATLAGALPYLDRSLLLSELRRVAVGALLVVVYDFRLDLSALCAALEIPRSAPAGYDHAMTLSDAQGVVTEDVQSHRVSLPAQAVEAAHVLLSSPGRRMALVDQFGEAQVLERTTAAIAASGWDGALWAQTWWARHRLTA